MSAPPTTQLRRRHDWPERLAGVLRAARGQGFRWGDHDCALFAARAVEAMTGHDPAAGFRGRYKTRRGAYGRLRRFAAGGLAEAAEKIAKTLRAEEIAPATAGRGDVVLVAAATGEALGVIDLSGRGIAVTGPDGLSILPRSAALRAWRVGP